MVTGKWNSVYIQVCSVTACVVTSNGVYLVIACLSWHSLYSSDVLNLLYTPLAELGHQRGRGLSAESVQTGEFGPSWVVVC